MNGPLYDAVIALGYVCAIVLELFVIGALVYLAYDVVETLRGKRK